MIYRAVFVFGFCSIVYEFLLAQAMAAFLENTVLRYCVTIGLYMCSKGFGSLLAEGRFVRRPARTLGYVEAGLTLLGGLSVVLLFWIDAAGFSRLAFSVTAHALIIAIGVLSGFELPLLIGLVRSKRASTESTALAWDYAGAFAGTICFGFLFYQFAGLLRTAWLMGLLNASFGAFVLMSSPARETLSRREKTSFLVVLGVLAAGLAAGLIFHETIETRLIGQYLNRFAP